MCVCALVKKIRWYLLAMRMIVSKLLVVAVIGWWSNNILDLLPLSAVVFRWVLCGRCVSVRR